MGGNGQMLIRYSVGRSSNLGKVDNKVEPWDTFKGRFRDPPRSHETLRAYSKLPEMEQRALKAQSGFYFRAQAEGGVRNRTSAKPTDLLTFDLDYPDPPFFAKARSGALLQGIEHFIHTSRRHTPDKPRFRLLVPVSPAVSTDDYIAVSRILARQIDPRMEFVDAVSFRPAQMMFFPTLSADSDYVFEEFEGSIFDPAVMLDQFEMLEGDWRDISTLPRALGESKLRETQQKAENPLTKKGVVGTFCRAYSVEDAIARFLPEVYTPVDLPSRKPRYTYAGGTTVNGAEVQDDGLFLYSHHGSDPCSDQLVNAFDLVRIHLYGSEDKDFDPDGKKVTDRPSWKSMVEFCQEDEGYRKQHVEEMFDVGAMFDSLMDEDKAEVEQSTLAAEQADILGIEPSTAPDIRLDHDAQPVRIDHAKRRPPAHKDWIHSLEITKDGVKSTAANVAMILTHDPRFRSVLAFNEFDHRPVCVLPLRTNIGWLPKFKQGNSLSGDPFQEQHRALIRAILESPKGDANAGYGMKVTERDLQDGLLLASFGNSFNPVREVLESFRWDGISRVDTLFIRYLGCPDTTYHRLAARLFMIAAVARVFEPGMKFDFVPVLYGAQGIRKSTFIKTLAMNWFGELHAKFDDPQKLASSMMGNWILEIAELASMARSQVEDTKVFLSQTELQVRMPWAHHETIFKRQCVFMGSTNNADFLKDETGNRRFWPIEVLLEAIDTDALKAELPLLWGEAVALYRALRADFPHGDLPLYMADQGASREAQQRQEGVRRKGDVDHVMEVLGPLLDQKITAEGDQFAGLMVRRSHVRVMDLIPDVNRSGFRPNAPLPNTIGTALGKLGWEKERRQWVNGERSTRYVPKPSLLARWAAEDAQDTGQPEDLL